MALSEDQILEIRKHLEASENPMFFFDDDCDGLCSFLLLKKFIGRGRGIIVKGSPKLEPEYARKVHEFSPDKIFIMDKPIVLQEFIDKVAPPIIWIDHHTPLERKGVKYFNPRLSNPKDNSPATYWCYRVTKQNAWIAMVGCIADWFSPPADLAEHFFKEYPGLCPEKIDDPEEILYSTELGRLIKIFSFILKGTASEAMKYINAVNKIEDPYEILNNNSTNARYINKRVEKITKKYTELLDSALKTKQESSKLLLFTYSDKKMSFTSDLSNELLHLFPERLIIIGREKEDKLNISLRSKHIQLPAIVAGALKEVNGYGGGHEYACGANIVKEDFKRFIESIKKQIEDTDT